MHPYSHLPRQTLGVSGQLDASTGSGQGLSGTRERHLISAACATSAFKFSCVEIKIRKKRREARQGDPPHGFDRPAESALVRRPRHFVLQRRRRMSTSTPDPYSHPSFFPTHAIVSRNNKSPYALLYSLPACLLGLHRTTRSPVSARARRPCSA